ncbi:DUF6933 domain-containing protein [Pseudofulvimonas gallinarii]|uniref:DUF6933 domain-containing protein n=1 Tax=Pseudofulvimonas gallinarii TaxID=634155 RepID=A0A4S3KZ92_9GAMM|nr:hypothetical protein [Pseudofulvimonas gallinarii]TCS96340.1 hypothetical protein EDC25_11528 [Pseudofulvimonas gallinarii]THD14747.1 hypothetical protein B1808_02385 [Pseudofulvimonas gallinarii]
MTTLFCTQELFSRLPASGQSASDDNRLGAWTAMPVPLAPVRMVLAVSDHARLPVALLAEPHDDLLERLPAALYELLLAIRFPADLARLERDAMQPMHVAPAGGRTALVFLEDYAVQLRTAWEQGLSRSPSELSLHLTTLATEHLEGRTPAQAARRRFQLLPDQTEALGL